MCRYWCARESERKFPLRILKKSSQVWERGRFLPTSDNRPPTDDDDLDITDVVKPAPCRHHPLSSSSHPNHPPPSPSLNAVPQNHSSMFFFADWKKQTLRGPTQHIHTAKYTDIFVSARNCKGGVYYRLLFFPLSSVFGCVRLLCKKQRCLHNFRFANLFWQELKIVRVWFFFETKESTLFLNGRILISILHAKYVFHQ